MKYKQLQKKTLIHVAVISGILLVLLAIYLFLSKVEDDFAMDLSHAERDVNRIQSQSRALDERVEKAQKSLKLYETIANSNGGMDQTISRKWAKNKLDILKDQYRLSSLTLKMSPVEELEGKEYQKQTTKVVHTEVKLSFSGLTDNHLLSFVEAVLKEFRGYARIDSLRLQRNRVIDNNLIVSISKGAIPEIVTGEITFHWLALTGVASPAEVKEQAP